MMIADCRSSIGIEDPRIEDLRIANGNLRIANRNRQSAIANLQWIST
jgi:hypothetical protein